MFKVRLASGIVLVVLALVFIITGGPLLAAGLFVISIIGLFEILRVFQMQKSLPAVFSYLATAALFATSLFFDQEYYVIILLILLALELITYVFTYPKYKVDDIAKVMFSFLYVPTLLSFVLLTRQIPMVGTYIVWLIFLCSWGCDTCAYCVGVLFGKHKMSPVLSPKKSVEGAVGGVVGTVILTFVFCMIFKDNMGLDLTRVIVIALLSAIGAFISMVGDLAASAIKRNYEIKDYGKLIPGHGGILDRFDSVIITAPIIFYLGTITL